jgi:hypothetical protein
LRAPLTLTRARLAVVLTLASSSAPRAAETRLDGSVRLRALHSFDDADTPSVTFGFLDTDLRAHALSDAGLSLRLDATFLLDVTEAEERRFGPTESVAQVRQVFARQPLLGERLELSVGRMLLWDAGNAWVDGLSAVYHATAATGLGVFGGLTPDPYDHGLDAGAATAGALATYTGDTVDGAAAYTAVVRGGALDRHFVFQRIHWRLAPGLYLADYVVLDLVDAPALTTVLASLDYTPVTAVNLTLDLSRYAIEQYRDPRIYHNVPDPNQTLVLGDEVADLAYHRARFGASLRFWQHLYHYQSIEAKHRSQDDREAYTHTLGLRDEDVLGSGLSADLSLQLQNGFQSDSELVTLSLDRAFGATLSLEAHATWFDGRTVGRATQRGRLFDEAQEIWLFGGAALWRPSRHHQFDASYDGVYETELQDLRNGEALFIHTLMGRYAYVF